jgi:hypothetical protein
MRRDDPLHGEQEGRFFHGYYDCYCYLPLYVFCGDHLLVAKLRGANLDAAAGAVEEVARVVARIRACWPRTRILLRADSGFAREELMAWCEANGVDFLFGLAQNERPIAEIKTELELVAAKSQRTGRPGGRWWRARLSKNLRLSRSRPPRARSCRRAAIMRPSRSLLKPAGGTRPNTSRHCRRSASSRSERMRPISAAIAAGSLQRRRMDQALGWAAVVSGSMAPGLPPAIQ